MSKVFRKVLKKVQSKAFKLQVVLSTPAQLREISEELLRTKSIIDKMIALQTTMEVNNYEN